MWLAHSEMWVSLTVGQMREHTRERMRSPGAFTVAGYNYTLEKQAKINDFDLF